MSGVASAWAGMQHPPRPAEKLVLWALADCADRITAECYPSVAAIVEFTGLDRKTVIGAMGSLERLGLIVDTGERRGRTRQVKVYRLPVESIPKTEPSQKRNSSENGAKESQKRDTEPVREPVLQKASLSSGAVAAVKPSKPDAPMPLLPAATMPERWDAFVELRLAMARGSKPRPWTPGAEAASRRALIKLAEAGEDPNAVLEQSVANGWQGLFEVKGNHDGRRGSADRQPRGGSVADALRAAFDRVET